MFNENYSQKANISKGYISEKYVFFLTTFQGLVAVAFYTTIIALQIEL